jgi:uncharacterized membrane protein
MKQLLKYLFVGIISLVPLFVVIQFILWFKSITIEIFDFISNYTNSILYTSLFVFLALFILILIGYNIEKAGRSFIISIIDTILEKVPAISTIYAVVKKITDLFSSNKKNNKKEVVLVEYPKKNMWVPAYILSDYKDIVVLFIPTSPNPTSGYTVIVDRKEIRSTTLTIAEASQFIISMGADFVKKEEISQIINKSKEEEK